MASQVGAGRHTELAATDRRVGRWLLGLGALAGPLYVIVGAIEALTRPGFDPSRDDLSLLSNGSLGWIHVGLLIVTGLLTIAGAIGVRRVLAGGRAGTWGPILLTVYGLGLIGSGFFIADPARGFPPGTPADAHAISWHGMMHLVSGGIGFIGLIAACMVFARRFAGRGEKRWTPFSLATGILFLAAFIGIASGSQPGGSLLVAVTLAFTAAVVLAWTWLTTLYIKLRREAT
ncbi:MAG TPA: DUF998 domain-containing protein [Candidatus Angelobacter sp.]|nr:DUF998 domain-containing protein [Candidatus Angelobacter sp.]